MAKLQELIKQLESINEQEKEQEEKIDESTKQQENTNNMVLNKIEL